jgi:putative drug exporter of the RND superfamily
VLFAGATVCIALLGQFALGVGILDGLAVGAALAVAFTVATSLTFLPAMLGFLGPRVLSRRERHQLAAGSPTANENGAFWTAWARVVEARPILIAVSALIVVVIVAVPILGLRLGTSDASTDPARSTTHQAYETLAHGFGPGFNGPIILAASLRSDRDITSFDRAVRGAARTPGVAAATAPSLSPNHHAAIATLYPTSSPQARQTTTLVSTLRADLSRLNHAGGVRVHVGGETATNIDFAHVLAQKLPLFIALVVLLASVLLMAVFRSVVIPLVAAVMNLLSIAATLGVLNAVFNWGWGHTLIDVSATGPIDAFLPVLMFSILFGLSMDYEMYLVGRIQEEWQRTGDNHAAIRTGQANSTKVIAAAAGIMILVFGSFVFGGQRAIQEFGFGLAAAVLIDALLIRSLIVPAVMHLTGPANWWMPAALDRLLPRLAIEHNDPPAAHDPVQRTPPTPAHR